MSESLNEVIVSQKERFLKLDNEKHLQWEQECMFARQQVVKNRYTLECAERNPASLKNSILNVAAVGISLNPAQQHAYLVPRDNSICLDISYRGLVKLATDCGAIVWAKAELVYENDTFTWKGPYEMPEHNADVFSKDRGAVVGGYCIAKLHTGEVMVEVMSRAELDKVKDSSAAKNGPWKTWPEEMMKKSITKRASKSWPQTAHRHRFDKAVEVLNEHEGVAHTIEEQERFNEMLGRGVPLEFYEYSLSLPEEKYGALVDSLPHGEKTKGKQRAAKLREDGRQEMQNLAVLVDERIAEEDAGGVEEIMDSVSIKLQKLIFNNLSPEGQTRLEDYWPETESAAVS